MVATFADPVPTTPVEPAALDGPAAAKFTSLSVRTLERAAQAGEPVGRFRVGRKVLYIRSQLESWLNSKATGQAVAR